MVEFTPDHLDRLRQVRLIAEHADSALWLMQHADGQRFALKLLHTPIFAWRVRSLFAQRLNLMLRIQHPHLATVFAGRVRRTSQCLVVTDYLPRGSLFDAVAAGERRMWALPLAPAEAARLVGEIAAGVQALHDHALLHGGLKLTNILLDAGADGIYHARVTDLLLHDGVAGLPQTTGKVSAALRDPLLYLAPEQYQRHPALASDQYALGVIAFLLLTGEAPFDRAPLAVLQTHTSAPLKASKLNPILPPTVDDVLARALRRAPRERFPSAQAFAEALQQQVTQRELARVLQLPAGSLPAARTVGVEPITQPHDAVQPLPPLAVLRHDQAPAPPGMPDLPPQYAWSVEAVARQAQPVMAKAARQPTQRGTVARRASTVLLWAALVVVLTLIIALTLLLTMSAMHH